MEDIVRAYGYLCLGSRFRRIGERLQADTQEIISALGVAIQVGQYPFLATLDRSSPLAIGELAEAVGITQPGATRTLAQLVDLGLVEMRASDEDQRRKLVSLTPAGQALVDHSKLQVWPRIEAAVREICADLTGPLLGQLDGIEDRLAAMSLRHRTQNNAEEKP